MGENTQEKNLVEKKEGFFQKVKNFFRGLFKKKEEKTTNNENGSIKDDSSFKENIKIVEEQPSEEMKILELQKRYRRGEIAQSDLTEEQIEAIGELYDKQIAALKKIIAEKEKQISEKKNA
jgi:hypothetical protein